MRIKMTNGTPLFALVLMFVLSFESTYAQNCQFSNSTLSAIKSTLDEWVYWGHPRECDPLYYEVAIIDDVGFPTDTVFYSPTTDNRVCLPSSPFGYSSWPIVRGAFEAPGGGVLFSPWEYAGFTPFPYVIGAVHNCQSTQNWDITYPIQAVQDCQNVNAVYKLSFGPWQFGAPGGVYPCLGDNSLNWIRTVVPSTGQIAVSALVYDFWSLELDSAEVTIGMSIANDCTSSSTACVSGLAQGEEQLFDGLTPGETLWLGLWVEGLSDQANDLCIPTVEAYDMEVTLCSSAGSIGCPEDISNDGIIDINDFVQFNSAFGDTCSGCPEDINGDGVVEINDFFQFNSAFGTTCQ